LRQPVLAGDLLVGWFSQYNASGQVRVSDNVNGSWTRSVAATWGGAGDIALYYRENSAAAPSGLTITVSASASAYLQEAIANYRHVATVGALDQAVVARGAGTYASVGPTAAVPAGELVVAAVLTGGQPRWAIPGSSALVPYLLTVHNGSDASDLEDILSSAARRLPPDRFRLQDERRLLLDDLPQEGLDEGLQVEHPHGVHDSDGEHRLVERQEQRVGPVHQPHAAADRLARGAVLQPAQPALE